MADLAAITATRLLLLGKQGACRFVPDEVLGHRVFPLLHTTELCACLPTCKRWLLAFRHGPEEVQRIAAWAGRWLCAGGASSLDPSEDPRVAFFDGRGRDGAAVIANLRLTAGTDAAWRVTVESAEVKGDLLLGLTRRSSSAPPEVAAKEEAGNSAALLSMGYRFIMGRESAPPSMFCGGRGACCCFTLGDGSGPRIDYVLDQEQAMECYLSKLRHRWSSWYAEVQFMLVTSLGASSHGACACCLMRSGRRRWRG
eukprot:CAMPEP_0180439514 /NCGR_PEP_ID=MMETSP1036_2-20121128/12629_1 /TAXON_ID=632150 /ORGANISM="Azadinium spinosum, Strain 3D9" /LENGTH=254 /DNA_ID=CAMNT_0022445659 /DNA_START=55 /DNA_END=815 /DNA_ORIENTATION=+